MKYDVVVIGTSAGGIDALKTIFKDFEIKNRAAVIVVQHLSPHSKSYLSKIIASVTQTPVYEIEDKMLLEKGIIYIAPPNYHVLIEKEEIFTLITTEKVSYARPSIDVTFESVADVFGEKVIGVLLTGANHDGGQGLKLIKEAGGYVIVQNPKTAESPEMPTYGIQVALPNEVCHLDEIGARLTEILQSI